MKIAAICYFNKYIWHALRLNHLIIEIIVITFLMISATSATSATTLEYNMKNLSYDCVTLGQRYLIG